MFVDAIENTAKYTKAIHFIHRNYKSEIIQPGTATLFFVNSDGWALTCKHVANEIVAAKQISRKVEEFRKEFDQRKGQIKQSRLLNELERKFGYSKKTLFELTFHFMNCVKRMSGFTIKSHKKYDVALIQFQGFEELMCDTFPNFPNDTSVLKTGKFLCRLGYPFPEFNNFEYDKTTDRIRWNDTGTNSTPRFPIEGMVTRFINDDLGNRFAIELSTPGLRGQSGGPAFDTDAVVWGMQFQTAHIDLNFDVDQLVLRNGQKKKISDSAFMHVGHCVHADVLKSFMDDNGVKYSVM